VLLPQTGGKPKKERREKRAGKEVVSCSAAYMQRAWKVRNSREATLLEFCKPRKRRKLSWMSH